MLLYVNSFLDPFSFKQNISQVWSQVDSQLQNEERELNAELVEFAVEHDYGGGGVGGVEQQQGVALTTIEIGGATSTTGINFTNI